MQTIINAKMLEGTLVQLHVLKMISFLNELETLGANIDAQTQVDMILNSLPQSFAQFKLNYNMNQMNFSMSELMSYLQSAKGVIKPGGNVLNVDKCSFSSRSALKGKKEKKKAGTTGPSVGPVPNIAKYKGKGKGKGKEGGHGRGKCFYCGEKGH